MQKIVLLIDERGKKYLAKPEGEMTAVRGLGTIRSDSIDEALKSGQLAIGSKIFSIRIASVDDIISAMDRKAQMLTSKDIAMIIHHCDIRPGSNVIEGGAGSGALSIAILARIGSGGRLTTYELREDFADIARRNIEYASLSERWILKMGNICEMIEERDVDAVVLDIPNPWDCIAQAKLALRSGGAFCAFVPNVNQVESTVRALRTGSFSEVRTLENLQREMVVHDAGVRPSHEMLGHTGYLVLARK
jgi:tRNA (adenine57-N1/adenine58-N1)-methyltransferase